MNFRNFSLNIFRLVLYTAIVVMVLVGGARAQDYFDHTVYGDISGGFEEIKTFSTPTGVGPNRKTVARIVTPTPTPDVFTFEIKPSSGKTQVEVIVDGATRHIEMIDSGAAVAYLVSAEYITDPPDNVTVASGFTIIRITICYDSNYDFGTGETWSLMAQKMTTDREYMGFIATSTDDPTTEHDEVDVLVTKPKIKIDETQLNFGDVQQGVTTAVAPVLPITVRNVGTDVLYIYGASIPGDTMSNNFEVNVFVAPPISIYPGGEIDNVFDEDDSDGITEKKGLWIMAHPRSLGEKTATVTIESSDISDRYVPIPLLVNGITLFAEILVDVSRSMSCSPDGRKSVPEDESRLYYVKEAGKMINNWIHDFSDGMAYLGLTSFPEPSGTCTGTDINSAVVVRIDFSRNTHDLINAAFGPLSFVDSLKPMRPFCCGTPMEAGIITAMNDMDNRINNPYLTPYPSDRPKLRQAILLFSDGAQTHHSDAASQIGPLSGRDIRVYTVGYGIPGSFEVDHYLLQRIAKDTLGEPFNANSLDTFSLKNEFKKVVTDWLGLRTVEDPVGTIQQGQTKTHTVCLDTTVYGVTFSVDWSLSAQGGIDLLLISPQGETITPASPEVAYYESDTFAMFVIRGKRLRGGQGSGEWTLQLTGGNSIPSDENMKYSYNVMVQSPVGLNPIFPANVLGTGSEYLLEVKLSEIFPNSLRGLTVAVKYDFPANSFGTWLSQGKIEPEWIIENPTVGVPQSLLIMGEVATLAQKKAYALANITNEPFEDERVQGSIQLNDEGGFNDRVIYDRIFSNVVPEFMVDGVYNFTVEAFISEWALGCVHREVSFTMYVPVSLSPELMVEQVSWERVTTSPYFDRELFIILKQPTPYGYVRKSIVFEPKDKYNNNLGPGKAGQIKFALKNAEAIGGVQDTLDGRYIQVIQFREGVDPSVTVSVKGVTTPEIRYSSSSSPPAKAFLHYYVHEPLYSTMDYYSRTISNYLFGGYTPTTQFLNSGKATTYKAWFPPGHIGFSYATPSWLITTYGRFDYPTFLFNPFYPSKWHNTFPYKWYHYLDRRRH